VVAAFFVVIAIGLTYAVFHLQMVPMNTTSVPEALKLPPPPTVEEYQQEVRSVFGPFLQQAVNVNSQNLAAVDSVFTDLVVKTQDRLLRVRVPSKSEQPAHLSFVLLLEQWKRALGGSRADQDQVSRATQEVLAASPWLTQ